MRGGGDQGVERQEGGEDAETDLAVLSVDELVTSAWLFRLKKVMSEDMALRFEVSRFQLSLSLSSTSTGPGGAAATGGGSVGRGGVDPDGDATDLPHPDQPRPPRPPTGAGDEAGEAGHGVLGRLPVHLPPPFPPLPPPPPATTNRVLETLAHFNARNHWQISANEVFKFANELEQTAITKLLCLAIQFG